MADFPVREISKTRFDIFAGYSRAPGSFLFSEELAYFSTKNDEVLGVLVRDTTDGDFGAAIIGPDENRQYRCVEVLPFKNSADVAKSELIRNLSDWAKRPSEDFYQGGVKQNFLDVFMPTASVSDLNPSFVSLATHESFSAARSVVERMMPYFEDIDGNFIHDFQTVGFDSRLWELYLFAALAEQGCVFDRSVSAPDYLCDLFGYRFFVEATTVNPTKKNGVILEPNFLSMTKEDYKEYLLNYMPIKWGSALYSKLQKEYWKLSHVQDRPIVFAIQDFHLRHSMSVSGGTLLPYLYGVDFSAIYDEEGNLVISEGPRKEHTWAGKTIPSGFFNQPGAENVSAVISNPLGTISKFNRIGIGAGFGSDKVRVIMIGTRHIHDRKAAVPALFRGEVKRNKWDEPWCGGMNIFHNPHAINPLDRRVFKDVAQHFYEGDRLVHYLPEFHLYGALNQIFVPKRLV